MPLIDSLFNLKGGWEKLLCYSLFFDKLEIIEPFIEEGKDVLDCGFVGEKEEDLMIHEFIRRHAKSCVGVDKNKETVRNLKSEGYEVVCQNLEELDLGRKFDVVFAGEVLEHLSNPGLFLRNAYEHLRDDGRVIITTPNPYFITMLVRSFFGIRVRVNPEHTCWFTEDTLKSLLERHKFRVERIFWCQHKSRWWINLLVKFRRNLARTIIVVAKKQDE